MYKLMRMVAVIAITALGGCGGGSPASADLAFAPADLAGPLGRLCSDPRADGWTLPIVKTSTDGGYTVSLIASKASPPVIGDSTTWTLRVDRAATGAPMTGATITARPWMPDHGHGTSVRVLVTEQATPGEYSASPLYLFMAGLWQITFTIDDGATQDQVVYAVCLADLI